MSNPVFAADLKAFAGDIATDTRDFVNNKVRPLTVRLDALEARLNGQRRSVVPSDASLTAENLANIVLDAIQTVADPLHQRISDLERRAATPGCEYAGTFSADKAYRRGQLVTRNGGLWLTLNDAPAGEIPGSSAHYKLIVKSGNA